MKYLLGIILFSVYPFLTFIGNNTTEPLDFSAIVIAWIAFFLLMLAFFYLSWKLIKNPMLLRKIVNTQFVFIFLLFTYGSSMPLMKSLGYLTRTWQFLLLWGVIVTLLLVVVWILSKSRQSTRILTVIVSAMMLVPVINIGIFIYSHGEIKSSKTIEIADENLSPKKDLPNVYHFLFDGYGRADHLLRETGFDSTPFFKELDQWGFKVIEKARSNYMFSYPSDATMFDMEYLVVPGDTRFTSIFRKLWAFFQGGPENPSTAELENKAMAIRIGQNKTVRMFKSLGYTIIQTAGGGSDCPPGAQDICIKRKPVFASLGETTWGLLDATPFGIIIRRLFTERIAYFEKDGRSFLPEFGPEIRKIVAKTSNPIYLFCRILLPHRPFLREDCMPFPYGYFKYPEDDKKAMAYQSTTLECLHQHIREVIPKLIQDDPEAIFIFSADHGFAYSSLWKKSLSEMPEEGIACRFGIFLAIRAPERCQKMLYPTMSLVNIYRFVRSCLTDEEPDYQPDRSYLYTHENDASSRHEPVEIMLWEPKQ
jgi:hypothetical protein